MSGCSLANISGSLTLYYESLATNCSTPIGYSPKQARIQLDDLVKSALCYTRTIVAPQCSIIKRTTMPSHMTALGFPVSTEKDFRHYVFQATEFGYEIDTSNGSYTIWEVGNGIELWVQTNLHKRIIGMNPHFRGSARMRVGITEGVRGTGATILDGAFLGWAAPPEDNPSSGLYPFVFDMPDYALHNSLPLPSLQWVQIAAFAYEMQSFVSKEMYLATRNKTLRLAPQAFIPISQPEKPYQRQAQGLLTGKILDTAVKTNPVTNLKFYWARIHTLGGEMDVVADPQVVQGEMVVDGIVYGTFWLSGRIVPY